MNSTQNRVHIPVFTKGDIGGITYLVTNNIVNYIIVIFTLKNVLKWSDEIVYGRVIPGMSLGLLLGGLVYTYMGWRLAQRKGDANVTALPSGVSTPAMFVILYGVIMPLHYSLGDPEKVWSAAIAATFIGGFVEFLGGFIGPWIKNNLPRAALLGTVAGIGFIWMATKGLFDVYSDPLIGLPILFIAMLGLFGGYLFPGKIPPLIVAIVGGIIYAYLLGRTHFDFSGVGFYFPNPINIIQSMINGFVIVTPYLTIIIPVEIYNFIETMDNVESANAAGDDYNVRTTQFADGICTMFSSLFGGVVPNTVWLGHGGLKKGGAGIGYSWISGVVLGAAGIFGLFTFLSALIPPAIAAITFLWCSVIMLSQAFKDTPVKHYAAIGVAMIPPVADFLYTQVTGVLSISETYTKLLPNGLQGYDKEVAAKIIENGAMWDGVPAVKSGAIIIGLLLASALVFIIDRRLDKVAYVSFTAAALSFFGFIHSASLTLNYKSEFMIGYLIIGVFALIFHFAKDSWLTAEENFEYV